MHGQVNNVGPGLKLAIGLRPSIKAVKAMWMTALLPFYESPVDTTGLALCHLGPSLKIMLYTSAKFFKLKLNGLLASSVPSSASFLDADAQRGQSWWSDKYDHKFKYGQKSREDAPTAAIDQDLTSEIDF